MTRPSEPREIGWFIQGTAPHPHTLSLPVPTHLVLTAPGGERGVLAVGGVVEGRLEGGRKVEEAWEGGVWGRTRGGTHGAKAGQARTVDRGRYDRGPHAI